MRDSNDAVFGAWMGEGIHMSKGAYYGSGESCVFRPSRSAFSLSFHSHSFLWKLLPDEKLRVFKWTGANDYVALCDPEYLSFGGGFVPLSAHTSALLIAPAGTVTMACILTRRSLTGRPRGVQRSTMSLCVRRARSKARASRSSVSGWRCGASAGDGVPVIRALLL